MKTAAVIGNILPQAKEIRHFLIPALKKEGIEVKVNQEYPPDIKDLTVLLSQVKQAQPDAIFVLSYPSDSVLYVRQAKELGLKAKFQWLAIGPGIPFFRKMLAGATNDIVTMGQWSPDQSHWPLAKPFYEAYLKRFKQEPDYLDTILAYMSCEILQQAVAKAGTDKNKLRDVIKTSTFQTINGPVTFKGAENATTPIGFLEIQNGGFQIVWPPSIATASSSRRRLGDFARAGFLAGAGAHLSGKSR